MQTAWQEGGDNDPVNQTAAMHLDLASWNFGIQEENCFQPGGAARPSPATPLLERGYLYPNDRPGLGIDVDEAKAAALLDPERAASAALHGRGPARRTGRSCGPEAFLSMSFRAQRGISAGGGATLPRGQRWRPRRPRFLGRYAPSE